MCEGEFFGVQEVPSDTADLRLQFRVLDCVIATAAVRIIADDREFKPGEMDTNLVCATGFKFDVEERKAVEATIDAVDRQCAAATSHDGHARAIRRIARQGLIYAAGYRMYGTMDPS